MKRLLIILLAMLPLMGMAKKKMTKPDVSVSWLRVENLEKPLGIDTDKPRFSWLIERPAVVGALWWREIEECHPVFMESKGMDNSR